jgi:hypothetical protein
MGGEYICSLVALAINAVGSYLLVLSPVFRTWLSVQLVSV